MATDVRHPKFWSYQFARTSEMRRWLYRRTENPDKCSKWLRIGEVHWVLDEEEDQTLLIRRVRVAASSAARFEVRTGRVATLAEVMFHGLQQRCTCYDVYKLYMALPIVIHKRAHPETGAPSRARSKRARTDYQSSSECRIIIASASASSSSSSSSSSQPS